MALDHDRFHHFRGNQLNMKTLITGSSGFLGATLVNDFGQELGDVVAVSRSISRPDKRGVKNYAVDICDPKFIDIVQESGPSAIIHTAARSIVRDCEQNPSQAFHQNVQGTVNVLEAARRLGTNIPVIVLETDKVYGQQPEENIPTSEEHPLLGRTPYEYSKVMTAGVCDFYRNYYGLRVYSLRPANIYGYWDTNKSRIIPGTFTRILRSERPIVFTDSKDQLREYVYVNDLCKIMLGMLVSDDVPAGPYNISSGQVYSAEQVIGKVLDASGVDHLPIQIVEKPFAFNEIKHQALTGEKLQSAWGVPLEFTPMDRALQEIWHRINMEGYGA